jgi:polysaccharide pyruvyl transferase WcaK-like protein
MCLFGAPGDTANLGVSALLESVLSGVAERRPDARVTVFDNGLGARRASLPVGDGELGYDLLGARLSRRVHRPESLHQMWAASLLGGRRNPGTRAIAEADAVLDLSGGDSFTDLYGPGRWQSVEMPKRLALQLRRPLVLLPQTYGPFSDARVRRRAGEIVRGAAVAWARDERSFATLRDLVGGAFDPERHRAGVDVAFGLPPRRPTAPLGPVLDGWLAEGRTAPVVGLNVSGLLFNDPGARAQFGLAGDYRAVVRGIVARLLADSDARVVLVPHVVVPDGAVESDVTASRSLAAEAGAPERVVVASVLRSPGETKWLISQLDWFCGTRMHATIAALSSGVPVSAVAYSGKVQGVFETCDQGDAVADARSLDAPDVVDVVWRSFTGRREAAARLAPASAAVRARAAEQMDAIVAACAAPGARAAVPGA